MIEVINIEAQVKGKLSQVVEIHVCPFTIKVMKFKVAFLLAKLFSDLNIPDCFDFRATRNKIWDKIDPYISCLPLQSFSQFQRVIFYIFLLN